MVVKLSNYDDKYRVVSLAKDLSVRDDLLAQGLSTMYISDNMLFFYPDEMIVKLTDKEKETIYDSCNYDVFEISDNGFAFKYYDNKSFENAIVVTNQCNSNCIMCPTPEIVRQRKESYSGEDLVSIVRHFQSDVPHLTITGGEPFMIKKDMFTLLRYLREHLYDTEYLLLTNGRVFCNKEYTMLFKETRPPRMVVGIPIHGYNSATHDHIVQSSGAFEQTFAGIKNLLATEAIIELRIVVSKLNARYISNIAKLISDEFRKVYCVKVMGLEMTGNAAKNANDVWLDYGSAFQSAKEGIDILIHSGIDVGLYNFPLCSVDSNYWPICEKSISSHKVRYAPKCEMCSIKDACGGIFAGTVRLAKDYVKPIEEL